MNYRWLVKVFPLIGGSFFVNMFINFIENYLANFTNARFWLIYQAARKFVGKTFFVIFYCYIGPLFLAFFLFCPKLVVSLYFSRYFYLYYILYNLILDKINNHIQKETSANQWKDFRQSSVIQWFVNIKEKERSFFMLFDIESFYLSIKERLFTNAIQFAKQITEISDYDMSLINQ